VIDEAVRFLRSRTDLQPRVAVVLGSGLGAFAEELGDAAVIPYRDIPGWAASTAVGHAGRLVIAKIGDHPVAVMDGRTHLYEGYTPAQVVHGVRVLGRLGVRSIVFTNAAGGVNPAFAQGALVLISDHINLQGLNPLVGANDETIGPRFPDMSDAYSAELRALARETGRELGIDLPEGIYAAMLGPSYETPAEIRFLRTIGADLVGMSTVAEVIAARHMGLEVLAISCVTNAAAGVLPQKLDHADVLATGRRVAGTLIKLLRTLLPRVAERT
jgi:purine-nucleoside phosphorylase